MRLDTFVGNPGIKALLSSRELSHAYILAGREGIGKRTLARLMAAAMVCTCAGEPPCFTCAACRKAMGGMHPDISVLGADGKDILVDTVRAMRSDAYIRPNEASRKVYIIENAQRLRPASQNVLLKLLEEGPAYAAFLLLTDNLAALLPTIRSRCGRLQLAPVAREDAVSFLRARFPAQSEEEILSAAEACEGLLGRAAALLEKDSGGTPDAAALACDFLDRLAAGDELHLMTWAVSLENVKRTREDMKAILSAMLPLLRDAILCHEGLPCDPFHADLSHRLAQALTKHAILVTIEQVQTLLRQCDFNLGAGHCAGRLAAACWEGIH